MRLSWARWRSTPRANQPEPEEDSMANPNEATTPVWQLTLAWAWVGIPLALGVLQTIINAMKLFQ